MGKYTPGGLDQLGNKKQFLNHLIELVCCHYSIVDPSKESVLPVLLRPDGSRKASVENTIREQ